MALTASQRSALASNLVLARKKLSVSQMDFAKLSNVGYCTVQRIELMQGSPQRKSVQHIAAALNTSVSALLQSDEPAFPEEPIGSLIGQRLVTLRRAKGLNQTDAAKIAGVSVYILNKHEKGDFVSQGENLFKIAQSYGLSVKELIRPAADETLAVDPSTDRSALSDIALEDLLHEIKRRGFTVTLS